jgi:hypothetical protein
VVNATINPSCFDRLVAPERTAQPAPDVRSRGRCISDHCPFVRRGIPALYIYTLGGVAHYHTCMTVRKPAVTRCASPELYALQKEYLPTLRCARP